ncbi:MAG TPA: hypothetical protein VNV87_19980 [Acidimicrobiales bacterium]|jgi:hypothetical protein|nr:hypothetical protein [Acidimicrobiales bacterium]
MGHLQRIGRGAAAVCVGGLLLSGGAVLASPGSASAAKTAVLTADASYDVPLLVASQKGPITVEGKYLGDQSRCTTGSNWSETIPKLVPKEGGSNRPEDKHPQYASKVVAEFKVYTSGWCFIKPAIARYQIFLQGAPSHAVLEIGQVNVRSFTTRCTDTASFTTNCATRLGPRVELIVTPRG